MKASLASTGNQKDLRLAFGVQHNRPAPAPAKVLRQVESEAQALAISIAAGNHKLAYVAASVGKSIAYVSRLKSGKRPIPRKLVGPRLRYLHARCPAGTAPAAARLAARRHSAAA